MIPRRFQILRPYLASFIHPRFRRPPVSEVFRWITQPGKERRAAAYIESTREEEGFLAIKFRGVDLEFYYPLEASWIDLCQTVDEVFNPRNWHHFVTHETPLDSNDVVVDCGAAEGLFAFYAAPRVAKVYAIEPIPSWHPTMDRTFAALPNVEVMKVGTGDRDVTLRMTNSEIYSRVSADGELEIPIRTLDSLFAGRGDRVSFLKADIEGFEFRMLLGAEQLITKNRPKIAMTVYHGPNHFIEMREFLSDLHRDYRFKTTGMAENGNPVLFQAY